MTQYQVIVGNIGTVCNDTDKNVAQIIYHDYVRMSKLCETGRVSGEAVTLMEDGEPIEDHLGWRHLFENYSEEEIQNLLGTRRVEDNKQTCPNCSGTPLPFSKGITLEDYPDGDFRYKKLMKCGDCGLFWYDILAVVGIELVTERKPT
jgi:hypothetical protein